MWERGDDKNDDDDGDDENETWNTRHEISGPNDDRSSQRGLSRGMLSGLHDFTRPELFVHKHMHLFSSVPRRRGQGDFSPLLTCNADCSYSFICFIRCCCCFGFGFGQLNVLVISSRLLTLKINNSKFNSIHEWLTYFNSGINWIPTYTLSINDWLLSGTGEEGRGVHPWRFYLFAAKSFGVSLFSSPPPPRFALPN